MLIRNPDEEFRQLQRQYEISKDPKILEKITRLALRRHPVARDYLAQLKREERAGPLVLEYNYIVENLGLDTWDKVSDLNDEYFAMQADDVIDTRYDEAGDYTEEWLEARNSAADDLEDQWRHAVDRVIKHYYAQCGLKVQLTEYSNEVIVTPEKSWADAALKLIEIINGVGYFYYRSLSEFVRIGPYRSPKEAVLKHLHWIKDWGKVYGEPSPEQMYQRLVR